MRVRVFTVPIMAVLAAVVAAGCSVDEEASVPSAPAVPSTVGAAPAGSGVAEAGPLKIVTTVSPITDIAANVGGDRALVMGIVPEGANSHTFEPAPSVARELAEADVVFINGLQLEAPTKSLALANLRAGSEIVELGAIAIAPGEEIYDFSFPKADGKPNPHLWTSPLFAKRYAAIVRDTLSRRDPAGKVVFDANYERFALQLDALTEAVRTATATVPEGQRKLLTYHDSFPYFARDFGWKVIGAIQPSDFSEPSPREVAALIDQVKTEKVRAIFGSEVFPSPVLEQIGREAGVTYVDTLRDDDLPGAPGDAEHSYLGLMRQDFITMIDALGGDPSALKALPPTSPVSKNVEYAQ